MKARNPLNFLKSHSLTLCLGLVAVPAFAGGISDGGGSAVVCRDANQKVQSAQLLDLYEAQNLHGLKISVDSLQGYRDYVEIAKDVAKQIDIGGGGVDPTAVLSSSVNGGVRERYIQLMLGYIYRNPTEATIGTVDSRKILLPPGVALKRIDDYNLTIIPANCAVEQLAVYRDNNDRIFIVGDIWEKLDNVNRAALLVHEALYRNLRGIGEQNSDRTRLAVGLGFARYSFDWILRGIPKRHLICNSQEEKPAYRLAIFPNSQGDAVLQFIHLDGRVMLSRTLLVIERDFSPLGALEEQQEKSKNIDRWVMFDQLNAPIEGDPKIAFSFERSRDGTPIFRIGTFAASAPAQLPHQITCREEVTEEL